MSRFVVILLLLATLPLRANLGESVAQCVARYGKPAGYSEARPSFPFGTLFFVDGGYALIVFLGGTKEVGARVTKQDKSAFSDAELKNIMAADSIGAGWTAAASSDPTCLRWTRVDKATALYDKQKRVLIFTSDEMTQSVHMAPAPAAGPSPSSSPAPTSPAPAAN
jgi:hypothetical protein